MAWFGDCAAKSEINKGRDQPAQPVPYISDHGGNLSNQSAA